MLQEESVVYEVDQFCPGGSTEAKWDSALEPHFQACHRLEMAQVLFEPWLCLGGPGLAAACSPLWCPLMNMNTSSGSR